MQKRELFKESDVDNIKFELTYQQLAAEIEATKERISTKIHDAKNYVQKKIANTVAMLVAQNQIEMNDVAMPKLKNEVES